MDPEAVNMPFRNGESYMPNAVCYAATLTSLAWQTSPPSKAHLRQRAKYSNSTRAQQQPDTIDDQNVDYNTSRRCSRGLGVLK